MIEGRGTVVIHAAREAIIGFVTDLERYKQADWKIGRVYETSRRADGAFYMRHGGKLRGIPGPSVALLMTIDDGGAHYRSAGTGLARWFLTFDGGFDLVALPGGGGFEVTHIERFRFSRPWRWIAEPFLRRWLQADVEAEMFRLKQLIEAEQRRSLASTVDRVYRLDVARSLYEYY